MNSGTGVTSDHSQCCSQLPPKRESKFNGITKEKKTLTIWNEKGEYRILKFSYVGDLRKVMEEKNNSAKKKSEQALPIKWKVDHLAFIIKWYPLLSITGWRPEKKTQCIIERRNRGEREWEKWGRWGDREEREFREHRERGERVTKLKNWCTIFFLF